LHSAGVNVESMSAASPYTSGFWSRTANAKPIRMPTSVAARPMARASSSSERVPLGRV
jgi:hypothetical protein